MIFPTHINCVCYHFCIWCHRIFGTCLMSYQEYYYIPSGYFASPITRNVFLQSQLFLHPHVVSVECHQACFNYNIWYGDPTRLGYFAQGCQKCGGVEFLIEHVKLKNFLNLHVKLVCNEGDNVRTIPFKIILLIILMS